MERPFGASSFACVCVSWCVLVRFEWIAFVRWLFIHEANIYYGKVVTLVTHFSVSPTNPEGPRIPTSFVKHLAVFCLPGSSWWILFARVRHMRIHMGATTQYIHVILHDWVSVLLCVSSIACTHETTSACVVGCMLSLACLVAPSMLMGALLRLAYWSHESTVVCALKDWLIND